MKFSREIGPTPTPDSCTLQSESNQGNFKWGKSQPYLQLYLRVIYVWWHSNQPSHDTLSKVDIPHPPLHIINSKAFLISLCYMYMFFPSLFVALAWPLSAGSGTLVILYRNPLWILRHSLQLSNQGCFGHQIQISEGTFHLFILFSSFTLNNASMQCTTVICLRIYKPGIPPFPSQLHLIHQQPQFIYITTIVLLLQAYRATTFKSSSQYNYYAFFSNLQTYIQFFDGSCWEVGVAKGSGDLQ